MRHRRRSTLVTMVALTSALAASSEGCGGGEPAPPATEVYLTVRSLAPVARIELMVRNFELVSDRLSIQLEGQDITKSPYRMLLEPSAALGPEAAAPGLFIAGWGYTGAGLAAGAAQFFGFNEGERLELSLVLDPSFRDDDQDGFPACAQGELCDCDDRDPLSSPFRAENCDDPADNNCVGASNRDGCPCSPDEPPVACTNLPERLIASMAGVGACYLGELLCVWDGGHGEYRLEETCDAGTFGAEIAENFADDDCDGAVDEGSSCIQGTLRPCHRGFVDDEANPDTAARSAASKRMLGVCAEAPAGWPAEREHHVQRCIDGRWSDTCEGDVLPQRETQGVGFVELPADTASGRPTQCNGEDDDCDGLYDEEPAFDRDGDGYTACGSVFDADPTTGDNRHGLAGLDAFAADCDDLQAGVHPGAVEVCGIDPAEDADEDCLCDNDDPATAANDVGGLGCASSFRRLDCSKGEPRSDPNPAGTCRDNYFRGFATSGDGREACFACNAAFGLACSAATGRCTTEREDCYDCPASGPYLDADIHEARPDCHEKDPATCVHDRPPVWLPTPGRDDFGDCGVLSCAGYRWGVEGNRCYDRREQAAATVLCKDAGACEDAADLCPGESARAEEPLPQPVCMLATAVGCQGTAAFVPENQAAGQDFFDECNDPFDCTSAGGEAFYFGVQDTTADGRDNPECYFRAAVTDPACDGSGACQTRAQACEASGRGEPAPRPACQTPLATGCSGTSGPVLGNVPRFTDPYDDCDGTCDGNGACHQQQGDVCSASEECEEGETCVDGVCCESSCEAACFACATVLTGEASGLCRPIGTQVTDTVPSLLCDSEGSACSSEDCVCAAGLGECKITDGSSCSEDAACLSGNCSEDFATAIDYCSPFGTCADGATAYGAGYVLCAADTYSRTCASAGLWSEALWSPDSADDFCEDGGGYDLAATCTSGLTGGFDDPPCTSCLPYRAATTSTCYPSCAANGDADCYSGYHCWSRDASCQSNVDGSCDDDLDCTSLRCDGTCMDKLPAGETCDEDSDCASGRCDGTCMAQLVAGATCDEDSDCEDGSCNGERC